MTSEDQVPIFYDPEVLICSYSDYSASSIELSRSPGSGSVSPSVSVLTPLSALASSSSSSYLSLSLSLSLSSPSSKLSSSSVMDASTELSKYRIVEVGTYSMIISPAIQLKRTSDNNDQDPDPDQDGIEYYMNRIGGNSNYITKLQSHHNSFTGIAERNVHRLISKLDLDPNTSYFIANSYAFDINQADLSEIDLKKIIRAWNKDATDLRVPKSITTELRGVTPGISCITLPYGGEDIDKQLNAAKQGSIRLSLVLKGMINILQGLKILHEHGIFHGDVKLSNMVTADVHQEASDVNQYRLIDFGLSVTIDPVTNVMSETTSVYSTTYTYWPPHAAIMILSLAAHASRSEVDVGDYGYVTRCIETWNQSAAKLVTGGLYRFGKGDASAPTNLFSPEFSRAIDKAKELSRVDPDLVDYIYEFMFNTNLQMKESMTPVFANEMDIYRRVLSWIDYYGLIMSLLHVIYTYHGRLHPEDRPAALQLADALLTLRQLNKYDNRKTVLDHIPQVGASDLIALLSSFI